MAAFWAAVFFELILYVILSLHMNTSPPTVTIPLSTAEKLTQIAQAMLALAQAMKQHAQPQTGVNPPLEMPDLISPDVIPAEDAWFWSEDWQKGEREVSKAYREGRYKIFDSIDDLLLDLDRAI